MNAFTRIVKTISRSAKMTYLKRKPEILVYGGIGGFIAAGILACFETKKASDVLDEAIDQINQIEEELGDTKEATKAKAWVRVKTAGRIVLVYLPAVGLAILSGGSICRGFGTLKARELDATAALALMTSKFNDYREQAKKIIGEEVDEKIVHGLVSERVDETVKDPETGKEKRHKVTKTRATKSLVPGETINFNKSNWNGYTGNYQYDIKQIEQIISSCNDLLHVKSSIGHPSIMLLSEVLEKLEYADIMDGEFKRRIANKGWISYPENPAIIDAGLTFANRAREADWMYYKDDIPLNFNCVDNVFGLAEVNEREQ